ncbi:hypothetical protein HOK021_52350 [Streptomyces hygroscopicus]|nr:hypothetical protein HOK021_52350 [Streptomyces hygroscopicus]
MTITGWTVAGAAAVVADMVSSSGVVSGAGGADRVRGADSSVDGGNGVGIGAETVWEPGQGPGWAAAEVPRAAGRNPDTRR